jgi:hypothetical protein
MTRPITDLLALREGLKPGKWHEHIEAIAALPELFDAMERMRDALEWYASDDAWTLEQVESTNGDYGARARAALANRSEGNE